MDLLRRRRFLVGIVVLFVGIPMLRVVLGMLLLSGAPVPSSEPLHALGVPFFAGLVMLVAHWVTRSGRRTGWQVFGVETGAAFLFYLLAGATPVPMTVSAALAAVATLTITLVGVHRLGRRHTNSQPRWSWWGMLSRAWDQHRAEQAAVSTVVLLTAALIAGGTAVFGFPLGQVVGALIVSAPTARYWFCFWRATAPAPGSPAAQPVHTQPQAALRAVDGNGALMQQSAQQSAQQATQQRSAAAPAPYTVPTKTFDDIGGYESAKRELSEAADFALRDSAKAIAYGIQKAGAILFGPAGTGKTTLMECLAGQYGARFRLVSASSLAAAGDAGDFERALAANVDAVIAEAQAGIPTVLAIDEIDGVARSRTGSGASDWASLAVTGLLAQVDRIKAQPGVLLLATTNHIETIDPALLRDGRLETRLRVDLPDLAARERILEAVLACRPTATIDIPDIAERTQGYTGAALTRLVNDAAMAAAKADRLIETADLITAWESTGGDDRPTIENAGLDTLVLPARTRSQVDGLIRRLKDRKRIISGNRPTGAVVHGPSGTGKTSLVKAIAAEAGMSFYTVQPGSFKDKWQGGSETNIRQLFEQAKRSAPSIVFLEEMDSLGKERGGQNRDHEDDMLNALLAEIDGMASAPVGGAGVFVIGATNHFGRLDPALTRSGRLEVHIEIGLPDRDGRVELLTRALAGSEHPVAPDVEFNWLVDATDGWAPSNIVGLVKRANDNAYDEQRTVVEVFDFVTALSEMSTDVDSATSQWVTA